MIVHVRFEVGLHLIRNCIRSIHDIYGFVDDLPLRFDVCIFCVLFSLLVLGHNHIFVYYISINLLYYVRSPLAPLWAVFPACAPLLPYLNYKEIKRPSRMMKRLPVIDETNIRSDVSNRSRGPSHQALETAIGEPSRSMEGNLICSPSTHWISTLSSCLTSGLPRPTREVLSSNRIVDSSCMLFKLEGVVKSVPRAPLVCTTPKENARVVRSRDWFCVTRRRTTTG